jgi:predicted 3-demethylubiquinone-9 3-methyltransferase (glyoxalase superfamily)
MKTAKTPRRRPEKKKGTVVFSRFTRAGMLMCAYDEARESGQKHSAAVAQAVDDVGQRYPEMPISETK